MLDAYVSRTHFADHVAPIWKALPERLRGRFVVTPMIRAHVQGLGIQCEVADPRSLGTVMVAGIVDLRSTLGAVIFVEHGAGQTYRPHTNPGYPGGKDRERVALFVCPSDRVAEMNRSRYPSARYVVAGDLQLDEWLASDKMPRRNTVAVSFHWPCVVSPESGSAWNHYSQGLAELPRAFSRVIGHGHPRWYSKLEPRYEALGIEPVASFGEVLDRASVYVVDNSSTGWEAMALGIPVVWMNAPWYRRNVEHGLRFWEWADSGVQVDEPQDLVDAIRLALDDPDAVAERRRAAVRHVFTYTDGKAAQRAADAICEMMGVPV